ncbi:phospholipase D-like domain-containing protein [Pseudomonas prosekii]|uniref:hypothetical protein n=1 Tax=Pseudomonas prosekii TaxID=1148509 RepID=UPI00387B67C1
MEFIDGKLVFSKDYIREIKHRMVESDDDVKRSKGKCPSCANLIIFSEAWTSPIQVTPLTIVPKLDEPGEIFGRCNNCDLSFRIQVTNPDLSDFTEGATKEGFVYLEDLMTDALNTGQNLPLMLKILKCDRSLDNYTQEYNFDGTPLYECANCNGNLDRIGFESLRKKMTRIHERFDNYLNWSLKKGRGNKPEHAIVRIEFSCNCGKIHTAFFSKQYFESIDFDEHSFSLCQVINAKPISRKIRPGVYSKDQILAWIYKLIPRWMILFDQVYIITPFIGHQWLKSDALVSIWLDLIRRLDPEKSKIITRHGQLTNFQNSYTKVHNIDYKTLTELELGSRIISETKQDRKFHAKIYCAISQSGCEVFSGSANFVHGPSQEVMHFNEFDNINEFYESFLNPLGLNESDIKTNIQSKSKYSLLFHEKYDFDPMRTNMLFASCYRDLMFNDIEPGGV